MMTAWKFNDGNCQQEDEATRSVFYSTTKKSNRKRGQEERKQLRRSSSKKVPIPRNHISRTKSETRLYENMVEAERSDLRMLCRIVRGIHERRSASSSSGVVLDSEADNAMSIHMSLKQYDFNTHLTNMVDASKTSPTTIDEYSYIHQHREQIEELLRLSSQATAPIRHGILPSLDDDNGGWSIGGYDESTESPVSTVQNSASTWMEDSDEYDEDCFVFNMDLWRERKETLLSPAQLFLFTFLTDTLY